MQAKRSQPLSISLMLSLAATGCSSRTEPQAASSSGAQQAQLIADSQPTPSIPSIEKNDSTIASNPTPTSSSTPTTSATAMPQSVASAGTTASDSELADELFGPSEPSSNNSTVQPSSAAAMNANRLQLKSDLAPEQLTEFLKLADLEMQNIVSGRAGVHDQREAISELVRVGKMKLQASEQLADSPDATDTQKSLGLRGQLQSLSHLAAQGDLKSAERLESLANQWVKHEDPAVVDDSRLVLIGLELEKLQNGSSKDPSQALHWIESLASVDQTHDIAALMVMGQAKQVFDKYGFDEAAAVVRDHVNKLFGRHADPNIASIAAQIAGSESFLAVEQQLARMAAGETVTAEDWTSAVQSVLDEANDMATVHFLASAAAQAEALGQLELVERTYQLIGDTAGFAEPERAETETIYRAYQARRAMIGKPFDVELESLDGKPLTIADYRGQVLLVPFWTVSIPDSLSQLQRLKLLREQFAGQVEIVGMNMDRETAEATAFEAQSPVAFRSFGTQNQFDDAGKNAIAKQFGVVSVPYVIVVDPTGKIAGYDFTGQGLETLITTALKN